MLLVFDKYLRPATLANERQQKARTTGSDCQKGSILVSPNTVITSSSRTHAMRSVAATSVKRKEEKYPHSITVRDMKEILEKFPDDLEIIATMNDAGSAVFSGSTVGFIKENIANRHMYDEDTVLEEDVCGRKRQSSKSSDAAKKRQDCIGAEDNHVSKRSRAFSRNGSRDSSRQFEEHDKENETQNTMSDMSDVDFQDNYSIDEYYDQLPIKQY